MKQKTLAMAAEQGGGFEQYRRATRRDVFLATTDEIVPWQALCEVIEPHYPKAGNGRPPVGLERMLRMCFVQHCSTWPTKSAKRPCWTAPPCAASWASTWAVNGCPMAPRCQHRTTFPQWGVFVRRRHTLLKFRRLLEKHQLREQLFATVGQVLQARGLKVGTGTIVDATIIGAPISTKNADKARDPEMRQTRKGQQWCFGMKMHIGVDSRTGLVHSAVVTAANVHDKHPLPDLLHGAERRVHGDSSYTSQKALIETKAPQASDFTNQRVRKGDESREVERSKNRNKSKVRARVEHVFAVVKRLWGFGKVRYRGLAKNAMRSFVVLGLANIYLARGRLA